MARSAKLRSKTITLAMATVCHQAATHYITAYGAWGWCLLTPALNDVYLASIYFAMPTLNVSYVLSKARKPP